MDTKYEDLVNKAISNGYNLERFQEILAKFNYTQEDINSASELYNLKKKGTTPSESQDAQGSMDSTSYSVVADSSSVAPSGATSQGGDYALGFQQQDILSKVADLTVGAPTAPLPYSTIKEEEDFYRSQNDKEGAIDVARRRKELLDNLNKETNIISGDVVPFRQYTGVDEGRGFSTPNAISKKKDELNKQYTSLTGDKNNLIDEDGAINEKSKENLGLEFQRVSYEVYDDVIDKAKQQAQDFEEQDPYIGSVYIGSMVQSVVNQATQLTYTLQDMVLPKGSMDQEFQDLRYDQQIEHLANLYKLGVEEDRIQTSATEDLFVRDEDGNLNLGDGFKKIGLGVAQTIPQIAFTIAAPEVALPVLGATSAAGTWVDVRDRADLSTADKISLAVISGAAEYAFERIGIGEIQKARKSLGLIDELPKSTRIARAKDWISERNSIAGAFVNSRVGGALGSATAEGLEELGVEITNQVAAHLIAGEEFNPYQISDSFLIGFAAGGGTATVPAALAAGASALGSSPLIKDRVRIINDIKKFKDLAANPNLSKAERKELELELERSNLELKDLVDREQKFYSSMNEQDQMDILSLNQKIRQKIDLHSKMQSQEGKDKILREVQTLLSEKQSIEKTYGDPFSIVENEDGKVERKPYKDRKRAEKLNDMLNELGIGQVEDTDESLEDSTIEFTASTDLDALVNDFLGDITDVQLQKFGTSRTEIRQALSETRSMFTALKSINPDSRIFIHKTPKAFENATGESALGSSGIFLPKESGANEIHLFAPALAAGTAIHEVGHEIAAQMGGGFIQEFMKGMQEAIQGDAFLSERYGSFLKSYIEEGADLSEIQEEFFAEFLQDLARGNVSVTVEKSLLNKLRQTINKFVGTDLKITDERSTLIEAISRMGEKIARGEDILDEALLATVSLEDGMGVAVVNANESPVVNNKRKRQIITSDEVETYSFKDVIDRVNGRVLLITSDNTGVGNVDGDELYGGLLYSFLPENVRDGVGFASVDTKSVSSVMKFVEAVGPEGQDVAVFIMQQSPNAMLGNYYAFKYFLNGMSSLVSKEQNKEVIDDLRDSLTKKKSVIEALKSGIPTKSNIPIHSMTMEDANKALQLLGLGKQNKPYVAISQYVSESKNNKNWKQNKAKFDSIVEKGLLPSYNPNAAEGTIDWSKFGQWKGKTPEERQEAESSYNNFLRILNTVEEITPETISMIMDQTSFKFRQKLMITLIPSGYGNEKGSFLFKKPYADSSSPLIKQILAKGGYSQADFFMKYSQPEFAEPTELLNQLKDKDADWGYTYSGFITNKNLDYGDDFQNKSGVVHPQFNAKIPSKENFLLDAGYQIDNKFKGILNYRDSNKDPNFVRVSIAGSMFMGTRGEKAQADIVTLSNSLLGGEKEGLTTQSVIKSTAKKRKRVKENTIQPSQEGTWLVSRDFESVMNDHPDLYKESIDEEAEASGTGNETQVTTNNGTYQKMINYFKSIDKNFKKKTFADINGGLGTSNQLKYKNGIENYQVIEPFYDRKRFPVYSMTMEDANKAVKALGLKESDKPHGELNKFVKKNEENFTRFETLVKKGLLPSSKLKPDYVEQNGYDIPSESVDYAMSNAVLNVIPGDIRQDVTLNFGRALKVGGVGVLSTRGKDVATNKSNVSLSEDPLEFYVASKYTYQKGFTPNELQAYVQDVLGPDFEVERYNKLSGPAVIIKRVDNSQDLESKFVFQKEGLKPKKRISPAKMSFLSQSISEEMESNLKKKGFRVDIPYVNPAETGSVYRYLIATKGTQRRVYALRVSDHAQTEPGSIYMQEAYRRPEAGDPFFEMFKSQVRASAPADVRIFNIYNHDSYREVTRILDLQDLVPKMSMIRNWGTMSRKTILEGFIEAYNIIPEKGRDKVFENMIYDLGFDRATAKEFTKQVANEFSKEVSNQEGFGRVIMANIFQATKKNNNVLLDKFFGDIEEALRAGKDLDDVMELYKKEISKNASKEELSVRIRKTMRGLEKSLIDRQSNIKRFIRDANMEAVEDLVVTRAGAGAWAKVQFNKFEKDIYGGLSSSELDALDKIIYAMRVIQIDSNFDEREKERPKHTLGFTKEKAEASFKSLKMELGTEVFEALEERANIYFNAMRELFKEAYDAGLISEGAYEALKNDNYSPHKFLNFVLNTEDGTFKNTDNTSKRFFEEIRKGSEGAVIMDSRYLLQIHTRNTQNKIFYNRMVLSLAEQVGDQDLEWIKPSNVTDIEVGEPVDMSEPGEEAFMYQPTEEKVVRPDKGYKNLYYFMGGQLKALQIKNEYYDELLDLEILAKGSFENALDKTLGTLNSILRFNATGAGNPLFFMKDFFRNWLYAIFRSDVYGRKSFTVSSIRMMRDLYSATKDKVLGREDYIELAKHGGLMDFLAVEASPLKNLVYRKADTMGYIKRGIQKTTEGLTYMSETTEVAFRVAIYKRDLKQRIEDFIAENGHEPTQDDLEAMKFSAARASREILDFSQGGIMSKKMDRLLAPYLNVAVQGTRGMVETIRKDPLKFVRFVTELGIISAAITWARLGRDDDNDDENIAEYDKRKNFIFWTGERDPETGKRSYIRIPKAEQLAGFLRVFEIMAEKQIKGEGAFKNWTPDDWKALGESFSMFIPVSDMNAFFPPAYQSFMAYAYNYDLFRKQVVSYEMGDILPKDEGVDSDRIEYFYKALGSAMGASPARMKSAVEKFATTPSNSILVSLAYGMADLLAYGTVDLGDEIKNKSKKSSAYQLIKALNPQERFIKESNPDIKKYQEDTTARELEMQQGSQIKMLKIQTEKFADALINKEMTMTDIVREVKGLVDEEDLQYMTIRWLQRTAIRRKLGIGSQHWDVYSGRTAKLQAYYLVKHFGDEEAIKQELLKMRKGIGFRPARGLKEQIENFLNNQ